jgi:hypothetical protein
VSSGTFGWRGTPHREHTGSGGGRIAAWQSAHRQEEWPGWSGASHASHAAGSTQSRRRRSQDRIDDLAGAGSSLLVVLVASMQSGAGPVEPAEVEAVRNFLAGLLLGALGMYWYLTQGDYVRTTVSRYWARASSSPVLPRSR